MKDTTKYRIRTILDGRMKRLKTVAGFAAVEAHADSLFGGPMNAMLGRTSFEKRRGRMTKGGPLIDVWECTDLLATKPLRILAVRLEDI